MAFHVFAESFSVGVKFFQQAGEAFFFLGGRGFVREGCGGGAGAGAVDEGVCEVKGAGVGQVQGFLKVLFGFAGEADDEVAGQGGVRPGAAEFSDGAFVFQCGVSAFHGGEDAVGAGLRREVEVGGEGFNSGEGAGEAVGEFNRV